ncbi:MAG: hypothetical protein KDA44_13170, partial [Planctomycetales bacterium]|nr:hypothetical protein [Planctomycetales bacterium]
MRGPVRSYARRGVGRVIRLVMAPLCAAIVGSAAAAEGPAACRVTIADDQHVVSPQQELTLNVAVTLPEAPSGSKLVAAMGPIGSDEVTWRSAVDLPAASEDHVTKFSAPAPSREGAYRVRVTVEPPAHLIEKIRPFHHAAPLAAAETALIVIDPAAKLPVLADQ